MADGEVEVETKKEEEEQEETSDDIKECKSETQEIIQQEKVHFAQDLYFC